MPADPKRIEAVFHDALSRTDPADRAAFLDAACAGDPGLRERVDRLLAAHAELGCFLGGRPPDATAGYSASGGGPGPAAGTIIGGRYKLLEAIGEGGMGTVYMAEQTEPVRRLVALKLVKPGMDSKAVLARFEAERQALALMDHPNIARVLDAGASDDGRPFFVMELVKGTPITAFCDERKLTPQQRLELFVPVCQAIQHAHQKGVIHRDVKPSNVLVALYDGHPVPKVIDFGVGRPSTSVTSTLAGLRSRWMTPFWWACCTAWHTDTNNRSRASTGSRCRSQYSVSGTPRTSSMTKNGWPELVTPPS